MSASGGDASSTSDLRILYTTVAKVEGGRDGTASTTCGRLKVDLSTPKEIGGGGGPGTNPEQLFATGYGACFQSTLLYLASRQKLDASGSVVTASVSIGHSVERGHELVVELDFDTAIDRERAVTLMLQAHDMCPYSKATKGNIDVTLSVCGEQIHVTSRALDKSVPG